MYNSVRRGYFYTDCSPERVGEGRGGNLFPGGKSFVVRIMGLRVEKSVAQRVVQASTRHIPSRGRLARHRKRFWPKTAPRIPTSSAPVIGPDRENKDSHGHNRGSTSGYGPVPYSYEHSATHRLRLFILHCTPHPYIHSAYTYREERCPIFARLFWKNWKRTGWLKRYFSIGIKRSNGGNRRFEENLTHRFLFFFHTDLYFQPEELVKQESLVANEACIVILP